MRPGAQARACGGCIARGQALKAVHGAMVYIAH